MDNIDSVLAIYGQDRVFRLDKGIINGILTGHRQERKCIDWVLQKRWCTDRKYAGEMIV